MAERALWTRARQSLAELLGDWELPWILWPGHRDPELSDDDSELQRFLTRWTCQNPQADQPVVLVLEAAQLVPVLARLQKLEIRPEWLTVLLLDAEQQLAPVPQGGGWFSRGEGPPAYAWSSWMELFQLGFWGSYSLEEPQQVSEALDNVLNGSGRRLLHLYVPAHEGQQVVSEAVRHYAFSSPEDSLEAAFLRKLPELLSDSRCLIWTLEEETPRSLSGLRCRPSRLAACAQGVAAAGLTPIIVIRASDLGQALPGLLAGLPAGTLMLVIQAGLVWDVQDTTLAPSRLRDLALLRQIHGLALTSPVDVADALQLARLALHTDTPIALRLTQATSVLTGRAQPPQIEAGRSHCLRQGDRAAILALGPLVYAALLAAEALASWGVECQVWDVRFLKPLDGQALTEASRCGHILTVEDHCLQGGLATLTLEGLSQLGLTPRVQHLALPASPPITKGTPQEEFGLDADGIQRAVRQLLGLASHLEQVQLNEP